MRMVRFLAGVSLAALLASCVSAGGGVPPAAGHPSPTMISAPPGAAARTPSAVTPAPAVAMPNPALTPGDVIAAVTAARVCTPGYARSARFVPASEKIAVYAAYGISAHAYGAYEVDHLVPLELGGSNDVKNLWPQPAVPVPGFHEKDDLETRLHDLVCRGALGLRTAQQAIASDWLAAYRTYVGDVGGQ
ncbi:MAG: HNH endonuclease signature motif containing protein [Dehalococcoidia bacterium]